MIEGLVGGFATEPGLRAQVTLSFEDIEGTKWTRLVGKFRVATRARGTPGLGTAPRKGARRAFFDLGRLVTPRAANVAYQLLDHQLDVGSALVLEDHDVFEANEVRQDLARVASPISGEDTTQS